MQNNIAECPHCGKKMNKCYQSEGPTMEYSRGWDGSFLYICFNDECPYFVKGWDWMWQKYGRKRSYRHAYNPATGTSFPIPVGSYTALKGNIIE